MGGEKAVAMKARFDSTNVEFTSLKDAVIGEQIQEMILEMQLKKETLLIQALSAYGITIDFEIEQTRRFKTITGVKQGQKELYYYNDGSINGLFIIGFENHKAESQPQFENDPVFTGLQFTTITKLS